MNWTRISALRTNEIASDHMKNFDPLKRHERRLAKISVLFLSINSSFPFPPKDGTLILISTPERTDSLIVVILALRDAAVTILGHFFSKVTTGMAAPASASLPAIEGMERFRLFGRRPRASRVRTHLAERE